jgi:hypothetical protein
MVKERRKHFRRHRGGLTENVAIWCANNGMTLNPKKCKIVDLSRFIPRPTPLMALLSSTWPVHRNISRPFTCPATCGGMCMYTKIRSKAAQILGFTARTLSGCTPRVKRTDNLALVKPGFRVFSFPMEISNWKTTSTVGNFQKRTTYWRKFYIFVKLRLSFQIFWPNFISILQYKSM